MCATAGGAVGGREGATQFTRLTGVAAGLMEGEGEGEAGYDSILILGAACSRFVLRSAGLSKGIGKRFGGVRGTDIARPEGCV